MLGWQAGRMAKGYSLDLRRRVFGAWQRGEGSQSEIAARFAVSVSFLRDLSRRFRESGDVAAKPYGGGRAPSVDAVTCERIKALVATRNDATIEEHRQSLAQTGCHLGHSTRGHWLHKLGLTRKKRPLVTMNAKPSASKAYVKPFKSRSRTSRRKT